MAGIFDQYHQKKEEFAGALLFFQIGDFFELLYDDAVKASKALGLTLTSRNIGGGKRADMCGVPAKSINTYVSKLVERGFKVAICSQSNDANEDKLLVREVEQVITAGTILDEEILQSEKNNYIASVYKNENCGAVAFLDISTGDFFGYNLEENFKVEIINLLSKYQPSEILGNDEAVLLANESFYFNSNLPKIEHYLIKNEQSILFKKNSICTKNLEYVCENLFEYCKNMQRKNMPKVKDFKILKVNEFLEIDYLTRKNLEICKNIRDGKKSGTLLEVLDKCKTFMGSRKLNQILNEPLTNKNQIEFRQKIVSELIANGDVLEEIRKTLNDFCDVERMCAKINSSSFTIKNAYQIASSLKLFSCVKNSINKIQSLKIFKEKIGDFDELCESVFSNIKIDENGQFIFNFKNNNKLEELEKKLKQTKKDLDFFVQIEQQKTQIKNLKIGNSNVFGYYLEIPKNQISLAPFYYKRLQTTINSERYSCQELKELEEKFISFESEIDKEKKEIFENIKQQIREVSLKILNSCDAIKMIDVLCSLSFVAIQNNYVKPKISENKVIKIESGRHPIIETLQNGFSPNSTNMNNNCHFMLITGPNMGGKSTYMRQVALIILMTQIGSFVPASVCEVGIVKQIFSRIGASDDIISGNSTFMVEMLEVANILNFANENSLVILDEVGRGTNTQDGLAIAEAVINSLIKKQCFTMFATHFFELTKLENKFKTLQNFKVAVKENNGQILFLHKIESGIAQSSYGLEVARLAKFPKDVLFDAQKILEENDD